MRLWLARTAVVLCAAMAVLAVLPPVPGRVLAVALGASAALAVVAAATAWDWVGTLTVVSVPLAAGAASLLTGQELAPGRMLLGAGLVLVLLEALDRVELRAVAGADRVTSRPAVSRLGLAAAALALAVVPAVIAASDVVPSIVLVLVGLVAVVAALGLATHEHRAARPPS